MALLSIEPLTDEWFAHRRRRVTASEVSVLLGFAPESWGSAYSVFMRITRELDAPVKSTPEMQWGTDSEPLNKMLYERDSGRMLEHQGKLYYQDEEYEWFSGSPDALITVADGARLPHAEQGVWEAKAPSNFKRSDWDDDAIPDEYLIQGQAQMRLTGLQWVSVSALFPPRVKWADVDRDEEFQAMMMQKLCHFWTEHVLRDLPPEPSGSKRDTDVMNALHKPIDNHRVYFTPTLLPIAKQVVELEEAKAELDKAIKIGRNKLRSYALLFQADEIVAPDMSFGWSYRERRAYMRPAKQVAAANTLVKMKKVHP